MLNTMTAAANSAPELSNSNAAAKRIEPKSHTNSHTKKIGQRPQFSIRAFGRSACLTSPLSLSGIFNRQTLDVLAVEAFVTKCHAMVSQVVHCLFILADKPPES